MREKKGEHVLKTLSNVFSDQLDFLMLTFFHLQTDRMMKTRSGSEKNVKIEVTKAVPLTSRTLSRYCFPP